MGGLADGCGVAAGAGEERVKDTLVLFTQRAAEVGKGLLLVENEIVGLF